jgi:hypothetical protein
MKSVRRIILTVTCFALLGVIANVAVAWLPIVAGFADRAKEGSHTFVRATPEHIAAWAQTSPGEHGPRRLLVTERSRSWVGGVERITSFIDADIYRAQLISLPRTWRSWDVGEWRTLECGFPCSALTSKTVLIGEPPEVATDRSLRRLPLDPVWPGFLINTAFYAMVLWALCATPPAIRRGLRRRRGACMRCGYDLRGGERASCPECGAA